MSKEEESVFKEIKTEEEAQDYILGQISRLKEIRYQCNALMSDKVAIAVDQQRRAYDKFRIHYGQALGSLLTLVHCRKLSNGAYIKLKAALIETTSPAIVGLMQ